MNSNRNNNRRRGRGNSRGGGGGSANQSNRIDNRARGNAPQLLEKYKKLANDAALNDDRVQTEYYLQFADHYFRVIADNKAQKDEARTKREAERGTSDDDDAQDDDGDYDSGRTRGRRGQRAAQGNEAGQANDARPDDNLQPGAEGEDGGDNPFTPEKRTRKPRKARKAAAEQESDGEAGLSADVLPPPIASAGQENDAKPRRRARSQRKDDSGDEPLEAVG